MVVEKGGAVAAIDCGTNSTRLLVVDADGEVLVREMRITRLGEGVDANRKLAPEAVGRTLRVLDEYRSLMDAHGVVGARLVATSATRDATNSEEFFCAARDVTGITPELIGGDEEGRLSFAGATLRLPPELVGEGPLLVVDIGGGSTELVVGDPREPSGSHSPTRAVSLDVGCVRVSERFFGHDPPLPKELSSARDHVGGLLEEARLCLPPLPDGGVLVGLAGTVSTLASLALGAPRYERDLVHHFVLGRAEVARWLDVLAGEDAPARLRRPGMVAGREDVIVGGVLVLDTVMDVFERDSCLVSEDDILDGIAASVRRSLA